VAENRETADIELLDRRGELVARLRIADTRGTTIRILSSAEVLATAEEAVQLVEGGVYDYALLDGPGLAIEASPLIQPSRFDSRTGRIEPGLATGLLSINLIDAKGIERAWGAVEVRTDKLDYEAQYRRMLDDIAQETTALLMHFAGPTAVRMRLERRDAESLHQQFVLLRRILRSREFDDAIHRVIGQPARRWIGESVKRSPSGVTRVGPNVVRQVASGQRRDSLPELHPFWSVLRGYGFDKPSIPSAFLVERHRETLDIPENRFVKHVLQEWSHFVARIEARARDLSPSQTRRLIRESGELREALTGWLAEGLFAEVSTADRLPFDSPLLQRRAGYREVLEAWLEFQFATALSWDGGREAMAGGQRNVAALYEFWVFFKLLQIVRSTFVLDEPPHRSLVERTADGLDLRLRSGREVPFYGLYTAGERPMRVRFSYNRSFPGGTPDFPTYPRPGAWTRPMRPDYTLSFWPTEFSEEEAERQELMVHVHFDAKYRVEDWTGLFGIDSNAVLDEEKQVQEREGAPKRTDLLKMHAYRDAIRRTEGAYVIYPGRQGGENVAWFAFNDVLPGLGAFALRPGAEEVGLENIRTFLEDRASEASRESERLEQNTYHTFRIQEPSGNYRRLVDLPKTDRKGMKLRERPSVEKGG